MSEPQTAAGRALLDALPLNEWHPINREITEEHILAIEAEARQQERERIRHAVLFQRNRLGRPPEQIRVIELLAILDGGDA